MALKWNWMWMYDEHSKIAQIYYYDPQSAGIILQSPQSDSTPWTLTLDYPIKLNIWSFGWYNEASQIYLFRF